MKEQELKFWEGGNDAFYRRMQKRHEPLWAWVKNYVKQNDIRRIIEVGGGPCSPVPVMLPLDGSSLYVNIDVRQPEDPYLPSYGLGKEIKADFRDVDPKSLPPADLLFAGAVIEHCANCAEFLNWALQLDVKHIVVSFFNRLTDKKTDSLQTRKTKKGVIPYNQYSRKLLQGWLLHRNLIHTIVDVGTDDILEISRHPSAPFDTRLALARELGIEVRHDGEQLGELFAWVCGRNPSRMIEIGSYRGGTALVFAKMLVPPRDMLLIDLCDRPRAKPLLLKSIEQLRKEGVNVEFFQGNSASAEAEAAAAKFGQVDFLYIDGSHKTQMVIHDYLTFRKYVRDGGLIGFHDVCRPKLVRRAWSHMTNCWKAQGLEHYIIGKDDWNRRTRPWATGIGVLEWHPSMADKEAEAKLLEIAGMVDKKGG